MTSRAAHPAVAGTAAASHRDPVLVALAGDGIGQSRTPRMHEREGRRLGLNYGYRLIDTASLGADKPDIGTIIALTRAMGFAGLNITHPFKQAVIAHLDALSDNAGRIGAVNTVVFGPGGARGHNTDMWGFAEGFRRSMAGASLGTVLLLGAGGAGAAVGQALVSLGAGEVLVTDIAADRAEALAARLAEGGGRARAVPTADLSALRPDGLVNASPVGMASHPGLPIVPGLLRADMWVADIVYFPLETELLAKARAAGCRTLSGAPMAVFQAVRAFELFTGIAPDADQMRASFDAF